MPCMKVCPGDDVPRLIIALQRQCVDEEAQDDCVVLLGILRTYQVLWSGEILCDAVDQPGIVLVFLKEVGPAEKRHHTKVEQFFGWTSLKRDELDTFRKEFSFILERNNFMSKVFYSQATTRDTFNKLFSGHLQLETRIEAFKAVLEKDSDLIEVQASEDYYFKELSMADAIEASSKWKFFNEFAVLRYQGAAAANLTMGAFSKKDNSLVSFAVVFETCCIGGLNTVDGHKRQKLASVVVYLLSKKIIALGHKPFVYIEDLETSYVSEKLFTSLGFTVVKKPDRHTWGLVKVTSHEG